MMQRLGCGEEEPGLGRTVRRLRDIDRNVSLNFFEQAECCSTV